MAEKIRFDLQGLEAFAEGTLDIRGRTGMDPNVPVHFTSVRLHVKIKTAHGMTVARMVRKRSPSHEVDEAAVEALRAQSDFVVSGIGDCGSCSSSSVLDAILFERAGVP